MNYQIKLIEPILANFKNFPDNSTLIGWWFEEKTATDLKVETVGFIRFRTTGFDYWFEDLLGNEVYPHKISTQILNSNISSF